MYEQYSAFLYNKLNYKQDASSRRVLKAFSKGVRSVRKGEGSTEMLGVM
jgi:hypothetical protein